MSFLDKNIIPYFEDKLDKSDLRVSIIESIKEIGISKTALKLGEKKINKYDINLRLDTVKDFESTGFIWLDPLMIMLNRLNQSDKMIDPNYFIFWLLMEKANIILDKIIEDADNSNQKELNSITESFLANPININWFKYIYSKYGFQLLDQLHYPSESNLNKLIFFIKFKIKQSAALLGRLKSKNFDKELIDSKKNKVLSDIYNMLSYTLGRVDKSDGINNELFIDEIDSIKSVYDLPYREYSNFKILKVNSKEEFAGYSLDYNIIEKEIIKSIRNDRLVFVGLEMIPDEDYILSSNYDFNEVMATCLDLDKEKRLNFNICKLYEVALVTGISIEKNIIKTFELKKLSNNQTKLVDLQWLREFAYQFTFESIETNLDNKEIKLIKEDNPIFPLL